MVALQTGIGVSVGSINRLRVCYSYLQRDSDCVFRPTMAIRARSSKKVVCVQNNTTSTIVQALCFAKEAIGWSREYAKEPGVCVCNKERCGKMSKEM